MAAGLGRGVLVSVVRGWRGFGGGAQVCLRSPVGSLYRSEIAVLDLGPDRARGLPVSAEGTMVVIVADADVVAAVLDGGGVEQAVDLVAVWLLVHPDLDGVEHRAVDLNRLVSECRVVEDAEDVVYHLLNWHPWVFPGIEDASAA